MKVYLCVILFVIVVLLILFRKKIVECSADGVFYVHTQLNRVLKYAYRDDKDNTSGYWTDEQRKTHITNDDLVNYLIKYYKEHGVSDVLDLGCGNCTIVSELNKNDIDATGVDQNNLIPNSVKHDLTKSYYNPKDYVQTFEVGEHIPKEYESIFIDNITTNAKKGIIMSWAVEGQGGDGHINERPVSYIQEAIEKKGFQLNEEKTKELRNSINPHVDFLYFRHNLMVFDRI